MLRRPLASTSTDTRSTSRAVFGDRWTLLVIRDLVFTGKRTYGEFRDSPERIATNILAERLALLEAQGVITKERDSKNGRRFVYRLTEKGVDLLPVLLEIIAWGAKHDLRTAAPPEFIERIRKNRAGLLRELRKKIRVGNRIAGAAAA